jgi:hypothetical protein
MKDYKKLKKIFADDKDVLAQLNHDELMDSLSQKESKSKLKKTIHNVFKGESGYTPEKGVDYFTEDEIKEWKAEILTKATPKKFKDYFTSEEVDTIARIMRADLKKEVTPVKNKDYFDGVDGKDANEKDILKKVALMIPTQEEILAKLPKTKEIDTKSIVKDVLNQIPNHTVITTEQVVKEIKDKRLLELRDIKGARLDSPRGSYSMNDQRWHGGGIDNITGLIQQGTNVTITGSGTSSDPYIISSSGGAGGIASINADTTSAQILAIGTAGVDFAIVDNGTGTHTFNLPTASATNRGALSSTDWTTFNNKAPTTSPTFATSITGSYLTASEILITDGSKNIVSAGVATYPSLTELSYIKGVTSAIQAQINAKGAGTVTAIGVTTANGVSGSSSGGATPNLTITLGAITPTTVNGITITANGTNTLNISAGKTLAVSNTLTLAGTDSTVMTFPSTSATIARTDAGNTFAGTQLLAENASIGLDPAGSADGKYTGITVTAVAGYTQAFGDLVYLDPTDSRWELCDANSAAGADGDSRGIIGMVVVAGTDGNACTILLQGIIRADAKFPTFTINNPVYVSETAGAVTQTQPVTTDVVIRVVGFAITADEMYFNPDGAYITHT